MGYWISFAMPFLRCSPIRRIAPPMAWQSGIELRNAGETRRERAGWNLHNWVAQRRNRAIRPADHNAEYKATMAGAMRMQLPCCSRLAETNPSAMELHNLRLPDSCCSVPPPDHRHKERFLYKHAIHPSMLPRN